MPGHDGAGRRRRSTTCSAACRAASTWLTIPKPLVGAATTYFVVNTLAIATAIALSTNQALFKVWNENFLWSAPSYFVGAGASAVATWLVTGWSAQWITPLAAAPLYLTYRTYKVYLGRIEDEQRHVREMADLHLATIEALALAIDAKDQTSQSHIRRVQLYAAAVARALGMTENDIQGVKTAALLHDIGKLAVPEHILSKPGPLTPEEFQKIRAHPKVGADIVSSVPFPYPVAPLILSHHERWDGKGYPTGLKGEEIPLGARILSVVDYFDALMAERPYHKAMSYDAAIGLLQQEAGKGLDPPVVAKFIELLPSLQAEATRLEVAMRKSQADVSEQALGQPATGLTPEPTKKNVFEDIALAHREIYALYEIAQAMGTSLGVSDTMALISAKLSNLVPFSCAALFLFDEESETLRCRFATGIDADVIQQIAVQQRRGADRLGRAQPPAARERAAERRPRGRRPDRNSPRCSRRSSARCCSTSGSSARCRSTTPRRRFYRDDHRRLLDRVSEQARRGHQQLDALRADAGRLADRSADGPAEHALPVHAPHARAGARRAPEVRGLADGHGPRQLQGDQRQPRAPCRRPRAVRGRARAAHDDPAVRHLRPLRRRRVHRRPVGLRRGRSGAEAQELQQSIDEVYFEARPGKRLRSASASARRSSRTTASRTRRCSRPPTAACIRTRPTASAAPGKTTHGGPRLPPRPRSIAMCRARPAESFSHRGASPLGLPDTLSRAPLRRRAPFAWLASLRSLAPCGPAAGLVRSASNHRNAANERLKCI